MRKSNSTLIAVLAAACITCGGTDKPGGGTGTGTGTGTGKTDGPLTVHKKKSKFHALILGTDDSGGTSQVPLAEGESKATVDVMWIKNSTPAVGGSSPTTLITSPQEDSVVRVGVVEQFAEGVGAQSRSSVWISSFMAASTLGHDLTDFKFTAEIGGFIDGPSAGALYTAGFLAALTGTPIDSDASMTGTSTRTARSVGLSEYEMAQKSFEEGLFPTAYSHIREAVVYAAAAKTGHAIVEKARARDIRGAKKHGAHGK